MTVKELKKLLAEADDDAVILLYNGEDECDTFCSDAVAVNKENYNGYCKGDSIVEACDCPEKLFVLAGFGCCDYVYAERETQSNIHRFADCPEAEESRRRSKELHEYWEREVKEQEELERVLFENERKRRYCLNFSDCCNSMREANYDTIEEARTWINNITIDKYIIYDRELNKVVESRGI